MYLDFKLKPLCPYVCECNCIVIQLFISSPCILNNIWLAVVLLTFESNVHVSSQLLFNFHLKS